MLVICLTNIDALRPAETSYGPTDVFQFGLSDFRLDVLPPAFLNELAGELRSATFRHLVSTRADGAAGEIPQFEILICKDESLTEAELLSRCKDPETTVRLRFQFAAYVNARADGHTAEYSFDALRELESTNFLLPTGFPIDLKRRYSISSKWIQPWRPGYMTLSADSNGPSNLPPPMRPRWLVVDGGFAWIYSDSGFCWRHDAQEYDSRFKPQFEAAWKEARSAVTNRVGDSEAAFFTEMQRILKQRFGINWRTPTELRIQ